MSSEYDLSTILTIPVEEVEVGDDVEAMARDYLDTLLKEEATQPQLAEIAWVFRRQLQRDLKAIPVEVDDERTASPAESGLRRLARKLLQEDESHAFSLAVYRRLLPDHTQ